MSFPGWIWTPGDGAPTNDNNDKMMEQVDKTKLQYSFHEISLYKLRRIPNICENEGENCVWVQKINILKRINLQKTKNACMIIIKQV